MDWWANGYKNGSRATMHPGQCNLDLAIPSHPYYTRAQTHRHTDTQSTLRRCMQMPSLSNTDYTVPTRMHQRWKPLPCSASELADVQTQSNTCQNMSRIGCFWSTSLRICVVILFTVGSEQNTYFWGCKTIFARLQSSHCPSFLRLTFKFPTWRWEAGDASLRASYLPQEQQYLITRSGWLR